MPPLLKHFLVFNEIPSWIKLIKRYIFHNQLTGIKPLFFCDRLILVSSSFLAIFSSLLIVFNGTRCGFQNGEHHPSNKDTDAAFIILQVPWEGLSVLRFFWANFNPDYVKLLLKYGGRKEIPHYRSKNETFDKNQDIFSSHVILTCWYESLVSK